MGNRIRRFLSSGYGFLSAGVFFLLVSIGPTAKADTGQVWILLLQTLHDVRELVTHSPPDAALMERTTKEVGLLLAQTDVIKQIMEELENERLVEADPFIADLSEIFRRAEVEQTVPGNADILHQIGFEKLAPYIAEPTLTDVEKELAKAPAVPREPVEDEGRVEAPSTATPSGQAGAEVPATEGGTSAPTPASTVISASQAETDAKVAGLNVRAATAQARTADIHRATIEHLENLEDFAESAVQTESMLYRTHTIFMGLAAGAAMLFGREYFDVMTLTPKETVGLIGGLWAANNASYYVIWQRFGFSEWLKKVFSGGTYARVKESWSSLLQLNSRIATPLATAAARDKPVSSEGKVGALEDAALESLLNFRGAPSESRNQMMELGMTSAETNWSTRSLRIYGEVIRRNPGTDQAELAKRIRAQIKATRSLELAVLHRRILFATFKVAALGLGFWAINKGVEFSLHEYVSRWRSVAFAAVGALGSRRILDYLWKPLNGQQLQTLFWRKRNNLLVANRNIMEIDRSGITVARLAQSAHSGGSRNYILQAALEALQEFPGGQVAQRLMHMLEKELISYTASSSSVRPLAEAAFHEYRTCQARLTAVRKAAAQFKPILEVAPF